MSSRGGSDERAGRAGTDYSEWPKALPITGPPRDTRDTRDTAVQGTQSFLPAPERVSHATRKPGPQTLHGLGSKDTVKDSRTERTQQAHSL